MCQRVQTTELLQNLHPPSSGVLLRYLQGLRLNAFDPCRTLIVLMHLTHSMLYFVQVSLLFNTAGEERRQTLCRGCRMTQRGRRSKARVCWTTTASCDSTMTPTSSDTAPISAHLGAITPQKLACSSSPFPFLTSPLAQLHYHFHRNDAPGTKLARSI